MKLKTGISPLYVKEWDIEKAIREIIQNYLDARQKFKVKGRIDYRNGGVTIHDFGPGLEPKHLALGISEKTEDLRGKFGEGLKLALLVFAREGREIVVRSRNQEIRPAIEYDEGFCTDVLVLQITDTQTPTGTQIRFPCTREELEAGKSYFIEFTKQNRHYKRLDSRITLPGGYIYINGTKVGELPNALYSYHLTEKEAQDAGNRDRTVVDMNKIQPAIEKILENITAKEVIERLWEAAKDNDNLYWERILCLSGYNIMPKSVRAWLRGFYRVFGDNAVLTSGNITADSQADYEGYKIVTLPYSWRYFAQKIGVPIAGEHIQASKKNKRVTMSKLTEIEKANFYKAVMLCEHFYSSPGKVVVVESLNGFCGNKSTETFRGGYDYNEDTIYLVRELLNNPKELLHCLLHETVHKVTKHGDRTEDFERALLDIAVNIIMRG